jgi:uncharacterized protein (TIGR03435 family)
MGFVRMTATGVILAGAAFAQAVEKIEFEVASIKPAPTVMEQVASGTPHLGMKIDGARVDIGTMALSSLIRIAYHVQPNQVSIPAALDAQKFDILAKIPAGASRERVPGMLQSLLADRFKLVIHREAREQSIYGLVVAKGGAKLKESVAEPDEPDRAKGIVQTAAGDVVRLTAGPGGTLHAESPKFTMTALTDLMRRFVDRPVMDMTGLTGEYQIAFDTSIWSGYPGAAPRAPDSAADPDAALIFMSIQKLGLRLEARKANVEVIVVDSAEKTPTAN